jgi:hypothetical protein
MSHLIRRATPAVLAAAVLGAALALPAGADQGSGKGPVAVASKCKKKKKAKAPASAAAKKKKKCKRGGSGPAPGGSPGLPGQPTPSTPQPGGGTGPGGGGPDPDPREVDDITVEDNPLLGGEDTQAEVTIDDPAPAGGQPVELSDTGSAVTDIPGSVHVAEGETTAGFTIETIPGFDALVPIEASIGTSSEQVNLQVVEEPSALSIALAYQCFPDVGQTYGFNRVFLDVPVPEDTVVDLESDDPASLTAPTSVTVPEGSTTALFDVNTLAATPLVTVTGNIAGTTATPSDGARVRDIGDAEVPVVAGVTLTPDSVAPTGSSTGTVSLNCEAEAGGLVVDLVSDSPDVTFASTGTTTATVTVPENSLSANFTVNTTADASGENTITADSVDTDAQEAILTIEDIGT